MCGDYMLRLGPTYQAAYYRDKLEAAEHALANERREVRRLRRFIARENGTHSPGIVHRCVRDAIDNG